MSLRPVLLAACGLMALAGGAGCLPDDRCDPGYYEYSGGCLPVPTDSGSGTSAPDAAASTDDSGATGGADRCEEPDAYFGEDCASDADCGCEASTCVTQQLFYCSRLNCAGAGDCPDGWTCADISAVSPDPSVTSLCLKI